jgi:hypothetical protein
VRGPGIFRLRFRANGRRCAVTVRGTKGEAQRKLRELLHSADRGEHVEPSRMTLRQWADQWLALLARGDNRRGLVGSFLRYCLLRDWVASNVVEKIAHYRGIGHRRGVVQVFVVRNPGQDNPGGGR